ncbi:hypothetical protein [Kitasatospora sp. NBC_01300]|uniref:hypothetical protein n=1 Tax=Kitasatospora sp. NBC_01300 TaxID=2903574 RepID=UPI00352E6808|nr:hypothetical protein OG556_16575 [Kitasatospora sp. NBC_01300]
MTIWNGDPTDLLHFELPQDVDLIVCCPGPVDYQHFTIWAPRDDGYDRPVTIPRNNRLTPGADNLLAAPGLSYWKPRCLFSFARCAGPQDGPGPAWTHRGTEPIRTTAGRNLFVETPTHGPIIEFPAPDPGTWMCGLWTAQTTEPDGAEVDLYDVRLWPA